MEIDSDDVLRLLLRTSRLLLVLFVAYFAQHEAIEAALSTMIFVHVVRSGSMVIATVGTMTFFVYAICALLGLLFERYYLFFVLSCLLLFPDVDRQALDDKHPPSVDAPNAHNAPAPIDGTATTAPGSITPPGTATPTPERLGEEARAGSCGGEELKDETEAEAGAGVHAEAGGAEIRKKMPSQDQGPPPLRPVHSLPTSQLGKATPQKTHSPGSDLDAEPEASETSAADSADRDSYLEELYSPAPKADPGLDPDANLREAALQAMDEDEELLEEVHQARINQTLRNRRYLQAPGDY